MAKMLLPRSAPGARAQTSINCKEIPTVQQIRLLTSMSVALCASLNAQNNFLSPTETVQTTQGLVQGVSSGAIDKFLGIPYAAPPVGQLRWKAPTEAPSWSGVRDAIREGSECTQSGGGSSVVGSEDCLFLNIYRPAGTKPGDSLPAIIFIHGGSNQQGTGNTYHPTEWVRTTQIIVVTINYRVNVFGYLALPSLDAEVGEPSSGNFGLMDQQASMRWVKANIQAFGGDSANITIGGESAGGIDVCANLVSPPAAGLFNKAFMESMYCPTTSHDQAIQTSAPVAAALGCTDTETAASCMRNVPAANVLKAAGHLSMVGEAGFNASPNFGSSLLPLQVPDALNSGQWNQSAILIGSNHDDASPFVSAALSAQHVQFPISVPEYQMLVGVQFGSFAPNVLQEYPLAAYSDPFLALADEVTDDSAVGCPVTPLTQMFAHVASTYRYEFNDQNASSEGGNPTDRTLGAYHGAELLYLFTVPQSEAPKSAPQQTLSLQMMRYWANFATAGDPNGDGLVLWPRYDAASHLLVSLKSDATMAIDSFDVDHHCAFWAAAPGPPFAR
jgi:para-nitrobenzyl esterase